MDDPNNIGDPKSDYQAARNAAALFDLSDRSQIELTGGDRVKFLHNFCTNDVNRLQPGEGCEAFVTNIKGRVLAHIFVFVAPDSVWIESGPGAEKTLLQHLDRYLISDDVQLHGRSSEFAELLVTGPEAVAVLAGLNVDVLPLGPCGHKLADLGGLPVAVRRVDWLRQPGFLFSVARDRFENAKDALVTAGVHPGGAAAYEALRIEAGFPSYGIDVTEENLAQEVGRTALAISFTKGCYLGQEPIARLDAMGHVNRQLCVLRLQSGPVPEPGANVLAGDETAGQIGTVTSATTSPANDNPVALAYLRSRYVQPETEVSVQCGDESIPAVVARPAGR